MCNFQETSDLGMYLGAYFQKGQTRKSQWMEILVPLYGEEDNFCPIYAKPSDVCSILEFLN